MTVDGVQYRVTNIICHHGPSATSGHYTSYHKQDRGWVLANNTTHLTTVDSPMTDRYVYIMFFLKQ